MGDSQRRLHVSYRFPEDIAREPRPLKTHISLEPLPAYKDSAGAQVLLTEINLSQAPDPTLYPPSPPKNTLRLFKRLEKKHSQTSPKLENLRYRILRGLKKLLRRVYARKSVLPKGLMAMDMTGTRVAEEMKEFSALALGYGEVLGDFADLRNGPRVDQARTARSTEHITYNNAYVAQVFRKKEVRECYLRFVRLLFAENDCESLVKRFEMRCCEKGQHHWECDSKWRKLRQLLEAYFGIFNSR